MADRIMAPRDGSILIPDLLLCYLPQEKDGVGVIELGTWIG